MVVRKRWAPMTLPSPWVWQMRLWPWATLVAPNCNWPACTTIPMRKNNYEFLVAQGNVYRQRGEENRALATFVLASQLDPQDPATRTAEMELAEDEGRPITDRLGMGADVRVNAVFEDENIYQEDARLLGVQNSGTLLPPPRRTIETFVDSRFQFRPDSQSSDSRICRGAQRSRRLLISERASDSESQYFRHHFQYFRGADCATGQRKAELHARTAVHSPARHTFARSS